MTPPVPWTLSPGVAATWAPALARGPRLLIPTQVDALVVRGTPLADRADTRLRDADPSKPAGTRQVLQPDPFLKAGDALDIGVHLHWALPDALTRGRPHGGEDDVEDPRIDFPPIPDRWLVARISGAADPSRRTLAGWVLDATGPVPTVSALDGFLAGSAAPQAMTAAGTGDLGWAAYYDNVRNRLGFHDDLDGVAAGPLGYLVCGWWTDPSRDPLGATPPASLAAFLDAIRSRRWVLDDHDATAGLTVARSLLAAARAAGLAAPPDPAVSWPTSCLVHGSAVAVGWPGVGIPGDPELRLGGDAGGAPDPATIGVGLGESLSEAFAAVLSQMTGGDQDPVLFEALQHGFLDELVHADGASRIDALLHATRYGSEAPDEPGSETIWQPVDRDPSEQVARPPQSVLTDAGGLPQGGLAEAVGDLHSATSAPAIETATPEGQFEVVERSRPRRFSPVDPAIVVQGAAGAHKHGGDGRYTPDGSVRCRLSRQTVTGLSVSGSALAAGALLERGLDSGAIPADCEDLLFETVLLDPGSATAAVRAVAGSPPPSDAELALRVEELVDQLADWWSTWNPNEPSGTPPVSGRLPSPLAVSAPQRPWVPLHVDWEVEFYPRLGELADWPEGTTDYSPITAPNCPPGTGVSLRGRGRLTSRPGEALAAAARRVLAQSAEVGTSTLLKDPKPERYASPDAGDLLTRLDAVARTDGPLGLPDDIVSTLEAIDSIGGNLDGFHARMRKEPEGQRVAQPGVAMPQEAQPRPPGMVALRAGFARVVRLRVVDAYGQFVDLLGSGEGTPADAGRAVLPAGMQVPQRPDLALLKPRFTAPARVLLRYLDAEGRAGEAAPGVSPVCGYVVPDPLDGAVEFVDPAGQGLGRLRVGPTGVTAWEEEPGRPTLVGAPPSRSVPNAHLGALADALLAWDVASTGEGSSGALAALLALLDLTAAAVDPQVGASEEHRALLVGNPVAVLRARVTLQIDDPYNPPENRTVPVRVRLGSLERAGDGLLGYYAHDDYRTLRAVDPAVGEELEPHPMIDAGGRLFLRADQPVELTLLAVPFSDVHATTGLLPQKAIGMRREWLSAGLSAMTPTFRFGPVLYDPHSVRLPLPADLRGEFSWHERPTPAEWRNQPVGQAGEEARLSPEPALASDGWLRFRPAAPVFYDENVPSLRITHVRRHVRGGAHRIHAVGGQNPDGGWWQLSEEEAVELVDSGRFRLYVDEGGDPAEVRVVHPRTAARYLRTERDEEDPNNLLSLPELA